MVFTLPRELSSLALGNRRGLYDLLFQTAWSALREMIAGEQGYEPAAVLVLHTWNQKLEAHCQVHALVPGGGYAEYAVVHEDNALPVPPGLSFNAVSDKALAASKTARVSRSSQRCEAPAAMRLRRLRQAHRARRGWLSWIIKRRANGWSGWRSFAAKGAWLMPIYCWPSFASGFPTIL